MTEEEYEKECQEWLDKLKDAGFDKIQSAEFKESLLWPTEMVSVQEMINRYGDCLTEEEVVKMKTLFPKCKFGLNSSPDKKD